MRDDLTDDMTLVFWPKSSVHTSRARRALMLAVLTASCGSDSPTAPTPPSQTTAALMSCPPAVARQSVDASPVMVSWPLPSVAGMPVDKSSCSPVSGSAFAVGTSTVTCAPDQLTLANSCSFTVTVIATPKLSVTRFLAFGDSITEGFVSPGVLPSGVTPSEFAALLRAAGGGPIAGISTAVQPANAYPTQLRNLLAPAFPTQMFSVFNRGLGGELTADGVSRLTSSIRSVEPEVLLLFEGLNDISLALFARPPGTATAIDVAPFAANLRSMVQDALGRGVEVLLATLTPVSDAVESSAPGTREAIFALNFGMRRLSDEFDLGGVVDLYGALDGVSGMLGGDGFHPTAAGYRRIAEIFFGEIVSRYDATPQPPTFSVAPSLALSRSSGVRTDARAGRPGTGTAGLQLTSQRGAAPASVPRRTVN